MWREKMIHSTLLKLQMPFESTREIIDSVTPCLSLKMNQQDWEAVSVSVKIPSLKISICGRTQSRNF